MVMVKQNGNKLEVFFKLCARQSYRVTHRDKLHDGRKNIYLTLCLNFVEIMPRVFPPYTAISTV